MKTNAGTRLDLLATVPKGGVCAELGIFEGNFSESIFTFCKPRKMFLVDLFEGEVVSGDQDGLNLTSVDMTHEYRRLSSAWSGVPSVQVVKSCSYEWLSGQPENSLDFVYIDTAHDYETTSKELAESRRAVKPNGLICGHDFSDEFYGVVQAVCAITVAYNLESEIFAGDRLPSFKIVNRK
jgi:hypothetical protein